MGFMTLNDFVDELLTVGGGAGHSPTRLKRHVNAGYFEVAGRADFSALVDRDTVTLVDGDGEYALPTGLLGVIAIRNTGTDHNRRLRETSVENFLLLDPTVEGEPTHFAHDVTTLYVHPTPNATYAGDDLLVVYRKEPTVLSTGTDLTVLPATFDMAICAFAKYFLLQNLERSDEARNWLIRGTNIMNSAISDLARFYEGEGRLGAGVAWDESDLSEAPDGTT